MVNGNPAVLITGGTGFIGAYVARDLVRSGRHVVTLDPLPGNVIDKVLSPEERQEVRVLAGDVANFRNVAEAIHMNNVDRIIHLASLLHPASDTDPMSAIRVNVEGQATVLEAARMFGLKKVVWASSVVVFGPRSAHREPVIPNDATHHPTSIYGATKSFDEFLTNHYIRQWQIDAIGLRPTLVYGPGRVRGASSFVNELIIGPALGKPASVPCGDDIVDWQYVEDLASLFVKCVDVPKTTTSVFNTRFDIRSIREAGEFVRKVIPSAEITYQPGDFGIAWEADDTPLQREIGFVPRFSMERGILEVIAHARKEAGLPPVEAPSSLT